MAQPDKGDVYSPEEMRKWLEQEVRDVLKAAELRVKDATDFVTSYAVGKLTAEEAADRLATYWQRWGDAIPGVETKEKMKNSDIVKRIDEERSQGTGSETGSWQKVVRKDGLSGPRK